MTEKRTDETTSMGVEPLEMFDEQHSSENERPFHLSPDEHAAIESEIKAGKSPSWRDEWTFIWNWVIHWLEQRFSYSEDTANRIGGDAFLAWMGEFERLVRENGIEYREGQPFVSKSCSEVCTRVCNNDAVKRPFVKFDDWVRACLESKSWYSYSDGKTANRPIRQKLPMSAVAKSPEDELEKREQRTQLAAGLNQWNLHDILTCVGLYREGLRKLAPQARSQKAIVRYAIRFLRDALVEWKPDIPGIKSWDLKALRDHISELSAECVANFRPPAEDFYKHARRRIPDFDDNKFYKTAERLRSRPDIQIPIPPPSNSFPSFPCIAAEFWRGLHGIEPEEMSERLERLNAELSKGLNPERPKETQGCASRAVIEWWTEEADGAPLLKLRIYACTERDRAKAAIACFDLLRDHIVAHDEELTVAIELEAFRHEQ